MTLRFEPVAFDGVGHFLRRIALEMHGLAGIGPDAGCDEHQPGEQPAAVRRGVRRQEPAGFLREIQQDRIAVDMAARTVLLKAGLKPGIDVNIVEARFGAMEAMLRQKKTDVAVFVAPFWARAQVKGGLRPLFYQRDGLGTTQFLLFAAKKDWVAKNRAVLVDWMEDYVRGVNWLLDPANRTKATEYAADYSKRKPEQLSWAFQKESDYYHDPKGRIDVPAFQSNFDTLHKLGVQRCTIDVTKYVDHSVVDEAAARIGK